MTNIGHNVLYIGMTNDLIRRVYEHKNKVIKGFTEKYNVNKLVYYETTKNVETAILREKENKKWRKEKKVNLIESLNPQWEDLSKDLL